MKETEATKDQKIECTYYWIINGRDVGVCKYCGEVKDFRKELKMVEEGIREASAGQQGQTARELI